MTSMTYLHLQRAAHKICEDEPLMLVEILSLYLKAAALMFMG
jgi:hypothetical protein